MVRVMVSSTILDLEQERNAIRGVLESLGFEALMSETQGSHGIPPKELCLRLARECDIYVLIIGQRYGTIIEGEAISVTEMEFNEAKHQRQIRGLEILGYVKNVEDRCEREQQFLQTVEEFRTGIFRGSFITTDELVARFKLDLGRNMIVKKMRLNEVDIYKLLFLDNEYRSPNSMYFRLVLIPLYLGSNLYDYSITFRDWFRDNMPKNPNGMSMFYNVTPYREIGYEYVKVNDRKMLIKKDGKIVFTEFIKDVDFRNILHKLYSIPKWACNFYKYFGYGDVIRFCLEIGNAKEQVIQPLSRLNNRYIIDTDRPYNCLEFQPYRYDMKITIDLFNSFFGRFNLLLTPEIIKENLQEMGFNL
jgi:hypothetical protein